MSEKKTTDETTAPATPSPQFKAADGPPPPHEETEASIHGMEDVDSGGDEERFAGQPLSAYEGMTDDQVLAQPHVGPSTLTKIKRARSRAARRAAAK